MAQWEYINRDDALECLEMAKLVAGPDESKAGKLERKYLGITAVSQMLRRAGVMIEHEREDCEVFYIWSRKHPDKKIEVVVLTSDDANRKFLLVRTDLLAGDENRVFVCCTMLTPYCIAMEGWATTKEMLLAANFLKSMVRAQPKDKLHHMAELLASSRFAMVDITVPWQSTPAAIPAIQPIEMESDLPQESEMPEPEEEQPIIHGGSGATLTDDDMPYA